MSPRMSKFLPFSFLSLVSCERVWLSSLQEFPDPGTLQIVHGFSLDRDATPEISLAGPINLQNTPNLKNNFQICIVHESFIHKLAKAKDAQFCCTEAMKKDGKCEKLNSIFFSQAVQNEDYYTFDINQETLESTGFGGKTFKIPTSSITRNPSFFYVAFGNCGEQGASEFQASKFTSGELVVMTKNGYLTYEQAPKLSLHLYLALAYFFTALIWFFCCLKYFDVLLKIHYYIMIAVFSGLFETTCWYTCFYHWNFIGHRLWWLHCVASFSTSTKHGLALGLCLLACFGLGVTRPQLESKKILQAFLCVLGYIVTDAVRLIKEVDDTSRIYSSDSLDSNNNFLSRFRLQDLLILVPSSVFTSILVVWIWEEMSKTINDLKTSNQSVKLTVYLRLRMGLGGIVLLYLAMIFYQILDDCFSNKDIEERVDELSKRYLYVDVVPSVCFITSLWLIMALWKPSEHTLQLAYSEQIADETIEMGDYSMDHDLDGKKVLE